MDNLTLAARSETMRRVRGQDTTPELAVRRLVYSLGYRYRLHHRSLPGCPDLVFPGRRAVIFVHGCFWHAHNCRRGQRKPKTNATYWTAKRERNRLRDQRVQRALRRQGWRVMVIWECQVKPSTLDRLAGRVRRFLG
jgi:DNA mismatch endonuclease (patch repair protein)